MRDADEGRERTSAIRKLNWRLMPFLMACFLVADLDRSNISVAALTMNADLGLTTAMYGLAAGLFFVTYTIFEIPSNLALEAVRLRSKRSVDRSRWTASRSGVGVCRRQPDTRWPASAPGAGSRASW